MIVRTIISLCLCVYAFWLTMRHNMHMFQLNGYKNDEQLHWIRKNLRQQWLLGYGMLLSLFRFFLPMIALDILIYISLLLIILVYRALHRLKSKKKLVYTARVKRMMATIIIISFLTLALVFIYMPVEYMTPMFLMLVSAQWFMNILANIVNHPIEAAISCYYINDAKKRLKDRSDLKIIGITGSYGKTSVKYYLQTLLQNKYEVLVTPGNFNTPLGVTRTIREHLKATDQIFICEMGARHVGDIREICDIVHPDYGVITSIGPQHLETFFNIDNIQSTKFELAQSLPENGMIFLNGDNDYIQKEAKKYSNKCFYYSEKSGEGYCAKDVKVSQLGTEFTVVTPTGETETFRMHLIGSHNVINVVGAIAVANHLGISLRELKIPVRRIEAVEHRMQMKEHGQITIIDDAYNSNPIGSKAAVETLKMFDGSRILITPGMVELGEKEENYNYMFGQYAADCCDYILLVGRNRTKPILEGALSNGFPENKCFVYDKLEDAVSFAYALHSEKHKYILLENDLPDNY